MRNRQIEIRNQIQKLAELLDAKFQLPFGIKIGWDGILGLVPGVGDFITSIASFYILYRAVAIGCPPSVILRMALNIVIDNAFDLVPFLGNIFDFFWKSNIKNVQLLDQFLSQGPEAVRSSRIVVALTVIFLLGLFVGLMATGFFVTKFVWHLIQQY